ncbi:hypothetical protein [Amycolatopsis nigrescens]|uniref:hypothetical protein n=1 Tax=Amycolatopsis nigrescens TaxID=381445 RepID=UPI00036C16B7|nr:hypothetical protein [Amycolatopsis nigrescens]
MTVRNHRHRRLAALLACAGLLVATTTACGSAKAGSAVPDGDQAATYVSAKFAEKIEALGNDFSGNESRKSVLQRFARVDEKKSNSTISAVQFGRPPARFSKNHSNTNSADYLDSFHPANSEVEYLQLGPAYAALAPTPWVSMPYTAGNLNECFWEGQQDVCKMIQAVADSVNKGKAAKRANSRPDGSVELSAEVTLGAFLQNKVIVFPPSLLGLISDKMKTEVLPTRLILDPKGKLTEIEMTGKIADAGHEVEVRMHYKLDGEPTANDLPKLPDASQVTVLPDKAAVDDFYRRLGEIQGG